MRHGSRPKRGLFWKRDAAPVVGFNQPDVGGPFIFAMLRDQKEVGLRQIRWLHSFAQLIDFLALYEFEKCLARYDGESGVRSFSCLDQFLCMTFAQLTHRESLRDFEACFRVAQQKLGSSAEFVDDV